MREILTWTGIAGDDEPLLTERPQPVARTGAAISGVGSAVPARVVPNAPIAERLGVSERWIEDRTGIRERRMLDHDERLGDLAVRAGAAALEDAGVDAAQLDMVIVATCTADEIAPAAAPVVAGLLGATHAGAVDLNLACTGFLAALSMACGLVESGRARTVLCIGADAMSRVIDHSDRRTAALFGDGAGAAVVGACTGASRIGPVVLGADGAGADAIMIRPGGTVEMDGHDTFKAAVAHLSEVAVEAAARAGHDLAAIDHFVFHQANGRILRAVGERLDLDPERVVDVVGHHGNTSAASIPLALAEVGAQGRFAPGDRVLLAAFGAGFAWGGAVIEWGQA
jgi:3-oxoacyl-[acyl-carrier-protein] synthase-3